MDESAFWRLIEETLEASAGDDQRHISLLVQRLVAMGLQAVSNFDYWYSTFEARAYRAELWDACYHVNCGCGDDGFSDFRAWLIGRGEDVYKQVLLDPETLVNLLSSEQYAESSLWVVTMDAYEALTGQEIPPLYPRITPTLEGRSIHEGLPESEWDRAAEHRFPRLFAKFGNCADKDF